MSSSDTRVFDLNLPLDFKSNWIKLNVLSIENFKGYRMVFVLLKYVDNQGSY
jgi:hypothetical protein